LSDARVEVRIDAQIAVAYLTIHNERKLNTLNSALMEDFAAAIEQLARDETLRAAVLTGAGERAFIGGADINEMAQLDPVSGARSSPGYTAVAMPCDSRRFR
jgi:enoyl-CoA hydratase